MIGGTLIKSGPNAAAMVPTIPPKCELKTEQWSGDDTLFGTIAGQPLFRLFVDPNFYFRRIYFAHFIDATNTVDFEAKFFRDKALVFSVPFSAGASSNPLAATDSNGQQQFFRANPFRQVIRSVSGTEYVQNGTHFTEMPPCPNSLRYEFSSTTDGSVGTKRVVLEAMPFEVALECDTIEIVSKVNALGSYYPGAGTEDSLLFFAAAAYSQSLPL